MATLRQIEANRRNALKSTGPTSVTGKAISSMNALACDFLDGRWFRLLSARVGSRVLWPLRSDF